MLEKGYPKKSFAVKSYYCCLGSSPNRSFLWKSIWKVKVPPRVAFFSWTAVLGKILTIDALRKRGLIIADWCCMCKHNGEGSGSPPINKSPIPSHFYPDEGHVSNIKSNG
jgi:hypothetical protein